MKTPVAFLVFNRPDTTQQVFNSICQAKPPKLLVVADGPRETHPDDAAKCAAVRAIIDTVDWDCEVLTNYSDINLGCKNRVSSGLDWVFKEVEEAIILEDDCLPDQSFFPFCEELLEKYRDTEKIMAISGDNFQFSKKRTEYSYYFSIYNHCWGWATWRRAWQHYDVSMKQWGQINQIEFLNKNFLNFWAAKYWQNKFNQTYLDKINTWDYQWTFTCWQKNGLTILPEVNLVKNIGFDSSGTHTTSKFNLYANLETTPISFPLKHPTEIVQCQIADRFTQNHKFGFWPRAYRKLRNLI
ncbi:methyltransferase FkbM (plasmid) [[Synechococcus] sp. NIES-970]|nr:methyltransferase FkbM [[Synechococcus] sp. NIES-970]